MLSFRCSRPFGIILPLDCSGADQTHSELIGVTGLYDEGDITHSKKLLLFRR